MIWKVYVGLLAIVATLFLLAFAAKYVHPRFAWWLQLLAIGLPVLSVLVVVGLVPAVLFGAWRLAAFHLALSALVLVRFAPIDRWTRARLPSRDGLTVMSFNADQKHSGPNPRGDVLRLFESVEPDLVGLQEITVQVRNDQPGFYRGNPLSALSDSMGYRMLRRQDASPLQRSLPILFRTPSSPDLLIEPDTLRPPHGLAPVTYVHFSWHGRGAVLYNVHLRSFSNRPTLDEMGKWLRPGYWLSMLRQLRQDILMRSSEATYLKNILDRQTLPFIVTGDLNSTPHNWIYRQVASGLTDAFRVAGRGPGHSFSSTVPLVRIDFVFASPHWEITSARVDAFLFSDHRPVSASLYLKDEP